MQSCAQLRPGHVPNQSMVRVFHLIAAMLIGAGIICHAATPPQSSAASPSPAAHAALTNQYCVACHNESVKTADLALDRLSAEPIDQNLEAWEGVVRKLQTRQMPPVGMPRPDDAGYDAAVASLVAALDRAAEASPNPGRTDTFRRLNRTEYRNAIRDLLAVDVDVSSLLPTDEASHGFDNITVGELSPTLLERYLAAAKKISRLAVGGPVSSPGGDTVVLRADLTQERHFDGLPFGTRGGTALDYTFPRDAEYEIQLRLTRDRDEHVEGLTEPHDLELSLDGKRVELFTVEPIPRGEPHHGMDDHLRVRVPVKAGPHVVSATFLKKSAALPETERQPYQARFNMDRHPRLQPALYSVSITGPYEATGAGDTPSRRRIFTCHPDAPSEEEACATQILSKLMRRAYRRPVTDADLDVPLELYREAREESGFEAGIEMALRALLVSPHFLFRVEQDPPRVPPNTPYRVSDLELASRLSFFLWSSIPDDELLDLAIEGRLRNPEVLSRQVSRMLADSRSEALITNFAGQWLYLRNLEAKSPDPRLFIDFDDNLRQAFRRETELFFESIMREDRNVVDLLSADYTYLNERLAKHYGVPHVYGSRFRRVTFDDDSVRGGLLSHGSILTVTSYATRTSPVIRGKWVLTNIMGTPPPPPLPNVPPLEEKKPGGKALSMRERLAEHRSNPVCASCHNVMDPVGFALENYDAIGRWRTEEDGIPIDASGALPDGSKFDGVAGLKKALLAKPEIFVTALTEKLLTYALGRGVDYYDAAAIREIVRGAQDHDYRFSSIIQGIVESKPFQMRMRGPS